MSLLLAYKVEQTLELSLVRVPDSIPLNGQQ